MAEFGRRARLSVAVLDGHGAKQVMEFMEKVQDMMVHYPQAFQNHGVTAALSALLLPPSKNVPSVYMVLQEVASAITENAGEPGRIR